MPVRRQECVLVEEAIEEAEDAFETDDAEQEPALSDVGHQHPLLLEPDDLGPPVVEKACRPLVDELDALDRAVVGGRDGEQRQNADDRPHLHGLARAVGASEPVVEEPVLLVPQIERMQSLGDEGELLEELHDQVGRRPAAPVEDRRDREHAQRVRAHPARAVGLLEPVSGGEVRAVERPDVVETEETALEQVAAVRILPVDPPGEVDEHLVEDAAQELDVARAVDREHLERRPGLYRRVDVVERPLVGRERAVRVLEPFAMQQDQLVLGEGGVDVGERDAVEREVPRGEPRVLPLVGHRHDVEGVEGPPARVPAAEARGRGRRLRRIAVEPAGDVVRVELLAPQHPGERLTEHERLVGRRIGGRELLVELVGLREPCRDDVVEARPGISGRRRRPESHPDRGGRAGCHRHSMPERRLRPRLPADGRGTGDDVIVDPVLRELDGGGRPEQPPLVCLVLAEEDFGLAVGDELERAEKRVRGDNARAALHAQRRLFGTLVPGPRVPVPGRREHVEGLGVRPGVRHGDRHEDVVRVRLGVPNLDDPVTVAVEGAGVEKLVLRIELAAAAVLGHEVVVGERLLRIVVAPPVPRMAG